MVVDADIVCVGVVDGRADGVVVGVVAGGVVVVIVVGVCEVRVVYVVGSVRVGDGGGVYVCGQ